MPHTTLIMPHPTLIIPHTTLCVLHTCLHLSHTNHSAYVTYFSLSGTHLQSNTTSIFMPRPSVNATPAYNTQWSAHITHFSAMSYTSLFKSDTSLLLPLSLFYGKDLPANDAHFYNSLSLFIFMPDTCLLMPHLFSYVIHLSMSTSVKMLLY